MSNANRTEEATATAVPAELTEWDADNVRNLGISFAPVADNTSEFTRTALRNKIPQRYFDVKMTFAWDNEQSPYLRVFDAVIPYVPPPKPQHGTKPPVSKYGTGYVYASLPRALLDHIVNEAADHGYNVMAGEANMPSDKDDWWVTLNLNKNAQVKVERRVGEGHTDANLSKIFLRTKLGVTSNIILSLKLKCSLEEVKKDDGEYYGHDEVSPVVPDENTLWNIGSTMASMVVSDICVDVPPPVRTRRVANEVPQNFAAVEADAGTEQLSAKLASFNL